MTATLKVNTAEALAALEGMRERASGAGIDQVAEMAARYLTEDTQRAFREKINPAYTTTPWARPSPRTMYGAGESLMQRTGMLAGAAQVSVAKMGSRRSVFGQVGGGLERQAGALFFGFNPKRHKGSGWTGGRVPARRFMGITKAHTVEILRLAGHVLGERGGKP